MLILQGVQIMGRNEVIYVADMSEFLYLFRFEVVQCSDLLTTKRSYYHVHDQLKRCTTLKSNLVITELKLPVQQDIDNHLPHIM